MKITLDIPDWAVRDIRTANPTPALQSWCYGSVAFEVLATFIEKPKKDMKVRLLAYAHGVDYRGWSVSDKYVTVANEDEAIQRARDMFVSVKENGGTQPAAVDVMVRHENPRTGRGYFQITMRVTESTVVVNPPQDQRAR